MNTLKAGTTLQGGKYRIESVLGQGGFGITYLATQTGLGRKVTVKEFFMKELCERDEATSQVSVPSSGSRDTVSRFRKKFVKEAQLIATLDNAHIVRIHDVFEENGTAYYVMDFIGGGSLSDSVKGHGPMDVATAVDYARQVADALDYIHRRRINHLDIKPSNILINDNRQAIVIDFGLSKRYDADGSQTSTTPVGISHGYAPLEQYQPGGVSSFSPQADIYALGATLFYLLTAVTPQASTTLLTTGFPLNELTSRHVPPQVVAVVRKAMAPLPKDRYQSISEMADALSHVAAKAEEPHPDSRRSDNGEATVVGVDKTEKPTKADTGKPSKSIDKPSKSIGKPSKADADKLSKDKQKAPIKWQWKQAAIMAAVEIVAVTVWTSCTSMFSFWEGIGLIWHGYSSPDMPEVYFTVVSWGVTALLVAALAWCIYRTRNVFLHVLARWAAVGFVFTFQPFSWTPLLGWTILPEGWLDSYTAFFSLVLLSAFAFALPLKLVEGSFVKTLKRHRVQAIVAAVVYAISILGCFEEGASQMSIYKSECVKPVDLGLSVDWAPVGADAMDMYHYHGCEPVFGYLADGDLIAYVTTDSLKKPCSYELHSIHIPQLPCRATIVPFDGVETDEYTIRRNWGQGWRLPTKEEMQELIDNCKWEWYEDRWLHSDNYGYRVKGKNGKELFLRAKGLLSLGTENDSICGELYKKDEAGFYMTGDITKGADGEFYAHILHFEKPKNGKPIVKMEEVGIRTMSATISLLPVRAK